MEEFIALALLEANARDGRYENDRLGLFLPLVLDVLSGFEGEEFTSSDVKVAVRRAFGMDLPLSVIDALLSRCCRTKYGYLSRSYSKFTRTDKKLPHLDGTERKKEIEKKHRELIDAMIEYAGSHKLGSFTPKQMRRKLAVYLDSNFRSLSIRELPEDQHGLANGDNDWIADFLTGSQSVHSEYVSTVVELVRGRVVYDAAFLPGFSDGEQTLKGLVAYLDSPLICRALGYVSDEEKSFVLEAIKALRNAGVSCQVLDCTVREIESVMDSVYRNWGSPREGEPANSYLYCMPMQGFDREYAFRVSNDAEQEIKSKLDVPVVPTPKRINAYVSDEKKLAERLKRRDGILDDDRIWHDVDCIAAVLTTRGGCYAGTIRKAKAFFVSLSALTIINVRKWWKNDEGRTDIAPIFSLTDLANLAWLYNTKGSSNTLSKEALMASCAAAMVPSEVIWSAWSQKLQEYVDKKKMTVQEAKDYLFSIDARVVVRAQGKALLNDDSDETFMAISAEIDARIARKGYGEEFDRHAQAEQSLKDDNTVLKSTVDEMKIRLDDMEKKSKAAEADRRREDEERAKRDEAKQNEQKIQIDRITNVITRIIGIALFLLTAAIGWLIFTNNDGSFTLATIVEIVIAAIPCITGMIAQTKRVKELIHDYLYKLFRLD